MKVLLVFFFIFQVAFGQNEQLAQNYFDKGDFAKAIINYQELLKSQPHNSYFFQRLVESHQQLGQYEVSRELIEDRIKQYKQGSLIAELGYNYQLQKDLTKANKLYEETITKIRVNPAEVYSIAAVFERRSLLPYALRAYKTALELQPGFNFNFQMAMLYGQLGDHDMMINTFLDESFTNQNNLVIIQNQLSRFLLEAADDNFSSQLKKALLLRAQKNQDIFWNYFLSWFYVQLKDYDKAFVQEKAIYKRNPESLMNILNLAQLSIEDEQNTTAQGILQFVLDNTNDLALQIQAHYFLKQMRIQSAKKEEYTAIATEIEQLLTDFGRTPYTVELQLMQAHFVAFNLHNTALASAQLQTALALPVDKFQQANIKMALADVLLLEEKYNQALLYYTQIEEDMKNDAVGHEASFKAARTSYFKQDFDWAQNQFKALKSASSQLIANDALEYFLLLSDNTAADSTHVALKQFARADFLLYQQKKTDALAVYLDLLKAHKGKEIEPVTLLRAGQIFEMDGNYSVALEMYQAIIDKHQESIYVDEALYYSANIYRTKLPDIEKAKAMYEKVIFSHQDSIHFVEARKRYRQLRGDNNL